MLIWEKYNSVHNVNTESLSHSVLITLYDPRECSLPVFSIHWILQARILEWVAIPFSRGSFLPRDWTWVSCTAGRFFTIWAPREALCGIILLLFIFKLIILFFIFIFSICFISWRLITLQHCSGFCYTLTGISHGFACVPHLDTPPTSLYYF